MKKQIISLTTLFIAANFLPINQKYFSSSAEEKVSIIGIPFSNNCMELLATTKEGNLTNLDFKSLGKQTVFLYNNGANKGNFKVDFTKAAITSGKGFENIVFRTEEQPKINKFRMDKPKIVFKGEGKQLLFDKTKFFAIDKAVREKETLKEKAIEYLLNNKQNEDKLTKEYLSKLRSEVKILDLKDNKNYQYFGSFGIRAKYSKYHYDIVYFLTDSNLNILWSYSSLAGKNAPINYFNFIDTIDINNDGIGEIIFEHQNSKVDANGSNLGYSILKFNGKTVSLINTSELISNYKKELKKNGIKAIYSDEFCK